MSAENYSAAHANYGTALDLAPHDLEAIMGLVRVAMAQQRYDEAETLLAAKLEELGHPAELYVALGLVYREAEQMMEAMRAFERAIAQKDTYAQAHFYLAAQLDQLGREEAARAALRRTLTLEPDHADALNYLGYLDAEAGINLLAAKSLIERALALDPENGAYIDSLGWVYYQLGQLDEAIQYLERAASQVEDPIIFEHLGDAYARQQDWERAKRSWERALELDPDRPAVHEKLQQLHVHHEVTVQP
jgi:tetratricopeptide (TPR) repeat protein